MDINYKPMTAQEDYYVGGSDYIDGAKVGELYKALPLLKDPTLSIDEINRERAEKGYTNSAAIFFFTENENAVLKLDPVGEDGRTTRDPEVCLRDPETGILTPSPELTEKFYTKRSEFEKSQREKMLKRGAPEYMAPLTVRRGKQVKEIEQKSVPIEGGGRSLV